MSSTTSTSHADNTATTNSSPGFFQNLKNAVSGGSSHSHSTNDPHHTGNTSHSTHSSHNSHDHSSTNLHPGLDRGINHVRSHNMNTTKLTQALEQYAQQQAALKQTGNAVAAAFQACLANDSGPYTQLSNEFAAAHLQLMAVNPPMPDRLIRESQSDFDARHQRVDGHVGNLTKLRGRVQHYVDKVNKLRADRDQRMASDKPLTQQELEKLDRNILKARTAEQNYNTANQQLIEEINQLHRLPVQHLGPALVAFIGAEQIYAAQSNALLSKIQMDAASLNANSQSWLAAQQPLIAPGTGIITNPSLDSVQRVDINHPTNVAQQQKAVAHTNTQQHHRDDSVDSVNAALGTTMIRSEEELRVGTERVEFERIVMRKYVTSEVVNVQVTLRKEHFAIDRTALGNNNYNNNNNNINNNNHHLNNNNTFNNNNANNYDNNTNNRNSALTGSSVGAQMSVPSTTALPSSSANTTVSGDWEIVLSSEHPVVTTKVVPYERIRVRKITERSMERVGADLRKENIDFTLAPSQYAQQQHAGAQVMVREHPETTTVGNRQSLVTENIDGNGIKEYQHDVHTNTYEKTDDYRLNNTNNINTNNANLNNLNNSTTGAHSATQPRSSLV